MSNRKKTRQEKPITVEKLAYSVVEAAKALGLSRDLVYDLLRTGELRSVKAGGRRIITREHIDAFLASHEGYEGTAA